MLTTACFTADAVVAAAPAGAVIPVLRERNLKTIATFSINDVWVMHTHTAHTATALAHGKDNKLILCLCVCVSVLYTLCAYITLSEFILVSFGD